MQNKTKIDHGSTRHVWGKRGEYIFLYFLFCKKEVMSKANNLLSLQKHKTYVLVFTRRGFLAAKNLESVTLQGPGTSSKGLKSFQMSWGQELSWDTKLPTRCTDRTPTSESHAWVPEKSTINHPNCWHSRKIDSNPGKGMGGVQSWRRWSFSESLSEEGYIFLIITGPTLRTTAESCTRKSCLKQVENWVLGVLWAWHWLVCWVCMCMLQESLPWGSI